MGEDKKDQYSTELIVRKTINKIIREMNIYMKLPELIIQTNETAIQHFDNLGIPEVLISHEQTALHRFYVIMDEIAVEHMPLASPKYYEIRDSYHDTVNSVWKREAISPREFLNRFSKKEVRAAIGATFYLELNKAVISYIVF
jgi:hypothetical protein